MKNEPTVSVLIPCYNLGRYLVETVESVFAQTRQDFEIIIVNDGSTDAHTDRLLRQFRRPRTIVLSTENQGLPAARNHALAHARGRFICALDADDCLRPHFFEKTLSLLEGDESLTFVSTWIQIFGEENWVWRQERCDLERLLEECVVLTAAPVRRDAVEAIGGYDAERFRDGHEDWDLWLSLVERGARGAIIPEILFDYRRRSGSLFGQTQRGAIRERLHHQLIVKHADSYRRHHRSVLLRRELEACMLLRENTQLEQSIECDLLPAVQKLRSKVASLRGEIRMHENTR